MKENNYGYGMRRILDVIDFMEKGYPSYTLYWRREPKKQDDYIPDRLRDLYRDAKYNLVFYSLENCNPIATVPGFVRVRDNNVVYDLCDL